jgi:hypothetical protein
MPTIHPDPELAPGPGIYPGMEWPVVETPTYTTVFEVQVTDLYGNVLTWTDENEVVHDHVEQYSNLSVDLPISDDRSAKLTLSLYDPNVQNLVFTSHGHRIAALGRMIRIKYRGRTIFWGIVTEPKFSTRTKQVEINCQGPTYKLKHRELNYSDPIVSDTEVPIHNPSDHRTIKAIVVAAHDTPSQYDLNIPDIGVFVTNVSGKTAPSSFWTEIQRGSNNWEKLIAVAESAYGGEFDVVPYDPREDQLPFNTSMEPL